MSTRDHQKPPMASDPESPEGSHEIRSLRETFSERRLRFATMDRPLRAATAGALATLVAAGALVALRDIHASTVYVGLTGEITTEVPLPLFVASIVLVCLGLAYLLCAATLAHRRLAVAGFLIITLTLAFETGVFGSHFGSVGFLDSLPTWASWTTRGLWTALWLVAIAARARDRRQGGDAARERHLRLTVLASYTAILAAWFTICAVSAPTAGGLNVYGEIISLLMDDVVLVATPMLQIAAVDFGEWGSLTAERIVAGAQRWARPVGLAVVAVASAALVIDSYANLITTSGLWSGVRIWHLVVSVMLFAAVVALVGLGAAAMGALRRRMPTSLSVASIFAVAAVGSYLATAITDTFVVSTPPHHEISSTGEFTTAADVIPYNGGFGPTSYTILIPRGWDHDGQADPGAPDWVNTAPLAGTRSPSPTAMERVAIQVVPGALTSMGRFLASSQVTLTSARTVGDCFTGDLAPKRGLHTTIWACADSANPSWTYVLYEYERGVPSRVYEPLFGAIARSLRGAGVAPATLATPGDSPAKARHRFDQTIVSLSTIGAACFVLLIGGYVLTGRRWSATVVTTITLLGAVSLFTATYAGDSFGRLLGFTSWPHLSEYGLFTAIGLLCLGSCLYATRLDPPRARLLVAAAAGLIGTTWALRVMQQLYDHALAASRISVWAAVIVLVAMAWDITMSGESFTNRGGHYAPRATRVLAFLGYVMLLTSTILFYTGQRATVGGAPTVSYYEPETVTSGALFGLAAPLALLVFALRIRRLASTSREPSQIAAEEKYDG